MPRRPYARIGVPGSRRMAALEASCPDSPAMRAGLFPIKTSPDSGRHGAETGGLSRNQRSGRSNRRPAHLQLRLRQRPLKVLRSLAARRPSIGSVPAQLQRLRPPVLVELPAPQRLVRTSTPMLPSVRTMINRVRRFWSAHHRSNSERSRSEARASGEAR